ncbi:hypothetical protein IL306_015207 [Fusarium sp. DS 682]|nr:hypothetical protein IL306_015207 [Fusarium sp. DS 682]
MEPTKQSTSKALTRLFPHGCMYPDQKLPALRLALMEKYPGIDLIGCIGPGPNAINLAPKEDKADNTKPAIPWFAKKEPEEDDKCNVSDFSLKK